MEEELDNDNQFTLTLRSIEGIPSNKKNEIKKTIQSLKREMGESSLTLAQIDKTILKKIPYSFTNLEKQIADDFKDKLEFSGCKVELTNQANIN